MAPLPDAQHAPIAALVPELDRPAVDVVADWKVPGAALAVVQHGKVSFATAHGHWTIEANLPATTATQFVIGSLTKSFTATGVALLHNEGRLDLTKPVRDYIPAFRLHDPVRTRTRRTIFQPMPVTTPILPTALMSIREQGGALHWSWRVMFAAMTHRHHDTFELPEVPDRLLPDRLAITFLTDRRQCRRTAREA